MLELSGTIEKIEKSNISNVDVLFFKTEDGKTKIRIELPKTINPFKEANPVKLIFDTKPLENPDTQKLILNAYIYSINNGPEINTVLITAGGLQLKIETQNVYDDFKTKKDLNIQFF